jgi:hypothetical protein
LRTAPAKRAGTLPAKLHAFWILKATAWATHGCTLGSGRASGWGARVGASPRAIDLGVGMLCQYSRQRPVSSEKHETAAEAGADKEG